MEVMWFMLCILIQGTIVIMAISVSDCEATQRILTCHLSSSDRRIAGPKINGRVVSAFILSLIGYYDSILVVGGDQNWLKNEVMREYIK